MSELKKNKKLGYLTEEEIIDFYELFFGNILIKKPNFSYYTNLSRCLDKESFIQSVLNKLNDNEYKILKLLSKDIFIPYEFLTEKLSIILNLSNQVINKAITTLIDKKYIFLRDNKTLVVTDVFFPGEILKAKYTFIDQEDDSFSSKIIVDINNLINYFISKEINFSNSLTLYKKDLLALVSVFNKYSTLTEKEYNLAAYFFSLSFIGKNDVILLDNIKEYFELTQLKQALNFVKVVFPWLYSILKYFYSLKKSVKISIGEFRKIFLTVFLLTSYNSAPFKMGMETTLNLLAKLGLISIKKKDIFIPYYNFTEETNSAKDDVRLSSSFNFYINANSRRKDFYMPALFSNFVKYNKITEYEITEFSVRRSIILGLTFEDIFNYINSLNINMSKNVEAIIKQWFDKYASYYYASGTFFFCNSPDKGTLINSLIKKGMIKAYEMKKNEIFYIKDEDKERFFNFLEQSGIDYYQKVAHEIYEKKPERIVKINHFLELE